MTSPPITLTIAGSDCSGGAGIQADLKTFQHLGTHGLSAVTSIVAETPLEIRQIESVALPLLQDQLNILLETYPISAIKTGLLPSRAAVIAIAEILKQKNIPLVVDPVMTASTGSSLTDDDTAAALSDRLFPIATLVTPNMQEASAILNRQVHTEKDLEPAARDIAEKHLTSCLVKGGHLAGNSDRLDVLWHEGKSHHFSHPTADIPGGIHGTGCTLSAAITTSLALNHPLEIAVKNAIDFTQQLITNSHQWHHGDHTIRCLGW